MQKRVMELESQTQLVQRQLRRIEDENVELRERATDLDVAQKRAANEARTLEIRLAETETREKQKDVHFRILEVELRAQVSDLEARLAATEIRALERTVVNASKLDNAGSMCVSTMSTSMFDPDAYRLQLTQSIIGDLNSPPASTYPLNVNLNATQNDKQPNANMSADQPDFLKCAENGQNSKEKLSTLERVQHIMERVSPYEKYGHLTPTANESDD